MVPDKAADIKDHKTNHSLQATGATELYTAGVPEKIIKERTGHKSLECLRMYERTSTKQHKAVSRVLSSTSGTNYSMEMSNLEHKQPETNAAPLPIMNFNKINVRSTLTLINQCQVPPLLLPLLLLMQLLLSHHQSQFYPP